MTSRVLLAFRRWSAVRQHHATAQASASFASWTATQQARAWGPRCIGGMGGAGGSSASASAASAAPSLWQQNHHHHHQQQQHAAARGLSSQVAQDDQQQQQQQEQQRRRRPADQTPAAAAAAAAAAAKPGGGGGRSGALEATLVWPPSSSFSSSSPPPSQALARRRATADAVVVGEPDDEHGPSPHPPALRRAPPLPPAPPPPPDGDIDGGADAQRQQHHPPPPRPSAAAAPPARLHVRAYHVGGEVDVPAFCAAEGPWSLRLLARDHAILRAADPTEETDLLPAAAGRPRPRRRRPRQEGGGAGRGAPAAAPAAAAGGELAGSREDDSDADDDGEEDDGVEVVGGCGTSRMGDGDGDGDGAEGRGVGGGGERAGGGGSGGERLFVVYRFGSVIFFGSDEDADDRWIRRIQAYTQDPSPEPVSDETTLVVVGGGGAGWGAGGGGGGGGGGGSPQAPPLAQQYPLHGADDFGSSSADAAALSGLAGADADAEAEADGDDADAADAADGGRGAPGRAALSCSPSSALLPRGAWFALQPDRVVLRRLDVGNARVISSVLGQSVALEHYHRRVDRALEALAPTLHEIAATGRSRSAASSDRSLLRLIGENSLLYTQVVAKLGLLDTSDAAWGKDRYHSVWRALRGDYELDRRFDALNRKLGPMLENAKFVLEVREDKKSERSELIIIALIGIEIVLHVAQHFVPAFVGAGGGGG